MLDSAAAFGYYLGSKAQRRRIESAELDAVFGGQAEQIYGVYVPLAQARAQAGRAESSIVEERAMAVDAGVCSFLADFADLALV